MPVQTRKKMKRLSFFTSTIDNSESLLLQLLNLTEYDVGFSTQYPCLSASRASVHAEAGSNPHCFSTQIQSSEGSETPRDLIWQCGGAAALTRLALQMAAVQRGNAAKQTSGTVRHLLLLRSLKHNRRTSLPLLNVERTGKRRCLGECADVFE